MGKVLISGGSGLLGSKITELLLDKGIEVAHLSTRKNYKRKGVEVFHWNPKLQLIDEAAFDKVDTLIHLAGAGIADKGGRMHAKKR
jgi:NAD dependent epimerase/dehydratase family enzyme